MAHARIKPQRLTVEEYLDGEAASDVRHEYLDGDIYPAHDEDERYGTTGMNLA